MKKIIVITSGKGGVGKTTTAINLGAAINYFNKESLIVDGNLSTPNLGVHLGSPEVPVNLNHVLLNKADLDEAIYEHESGIKIIPSSLSVTELKKIKPEKIKDFKKDFKNISDYIIVDSAAGLGNEAISTIELADELIIVTNPEIPAITDALKTIKIAEKMKKPVLGVIITKVRKDDLEMQSETVKEMLEVPILGMVPHDLDIKRALNLRNAVVNTHPKSKSARAYKEIAAKILDVEYNSDKDKERLLERIFNKLRMKNRNN
jgi:cell division ATPase MinD|tara:strand:- start:1848 stop:2633 length:786 start_codon:yes stop_codon:yes gene_type:complete